jgi:F420-dependent oxidoreductase-like protein
VLLAAIGPKNVELAAEIAEKWEPIFFHPERAAEVWGAALAAGKAKRDPALGNLDVVVGMPVAIGEDVDHLLEAVRPGVALYVGGMGAKGRNFYNDLARRYGYEAEAETIQELYLSGRKDEAAAAVPDDLVRATSLIGPESYVAERIAAFAEAGVTTINVQPMDDSRESRLRTVETIKRLAG